VLRTGDAIQQCWIEKGGGFITSKIEPALLVNAYFSSRKMGLAAEGVSPPGTDLAIDLACRQTAVAQEMHRRRTWNA